MSASAAAACLHATDGVERHTPAINTAASADDFLVICSRAMEHEHARVAAMHTPDDGGYQVRDAASNL